MAGLYILLDPATTFLKIGRARNLETRLANLRIANPWLQVVQWFETANESLVESYVHPKLVAHRREGEFFAVPAEVAQREVLAFSALLSNRPEQLQVEEVRSIQTLAENRDPTDAEVLLMQKIIDMRAKIKIFDTEEKILSDQLVVLLGRANGLTGWATFNFEEIIRLINTTHKLTNFLEDDREDDF